MPPSQVKVVHRSRPAAAAAAASERKGSWIKSVAGELARPLLAHHSDYGQNNQSVSNSMIWRLASES